MTLPIPPNNEIAPIRDVEFMMSALKLLFPLAGLDPHYIFDVSIQYDINRLSSMLCISAFDVDLKITLRSSWVLMTRKQVIDSVLEPTLYYIKHIHGVTVL
jgi:hypothetical protein